MHDFSYSFFLPKKANKLSCSENRLFLPQRAQRRHKVRNAFDTTDFLHSERLSLSTKIVAFWLEQEQRAESWAPCEKSKFVLAKRANGESLARSTVQEENAANSQTATKASFSLSLSF